MRWIFISGAAVLLLVLLAAAGLVWWRLRVRRRRPPALVPRYPIVLVHGLCGFDELRIFGWKRQYFVGIGQHLRKLGVTVHHVRLPALASVPERAARLATFVASIPGPRVNLIAHSMGGLDARYAIAKLGLADKIASLVTIGTPHRGTPLAELGQLGPALAARALVKRLGFGSDCLDWLTEARMAAFNSEILDHPRVHYLSVVCRAGEGLWGRNPLFLASQAFINRRAGSNDGLVPVLSQQWGRTLCEIQADHWAQIGWFTFSDARPVYANIIGYLAREGL